MEKPLNDRQEQNARPIFNERQCVILTHLSRLPMFVGVSNSVSLRIMWLIKKDQLKAVDDHGKEILNLVTVFFVVVLSIAFFFTIVGIVLAVLLLVFGLFVSVAHQNAAAVKVNIGKTHNHYPFTYRFLR